jgi:helix-turn-helix protein
MTNREKKIVSLLEEGFSYDTIKKMSDTHINMLYNRLVKEAVVRVATCRKGHTINEIKDGLN